MRKKNINTAQYSVHPVPQKLIKWYEVKMTYEEKYRFGLLTYGEYIEWMQELQDAETVNDTQEVACASGELTEDDKGTFWHKDGGERKNVSSGDYTEFLSENHVDVSNRNTVDFDKLATEVNGPAVSEEVSCDDILKQVNKDIHGDTYLSQEEIEALFAASAAAG